MAQSRPPPEAEESGSWVERYGRFMTIADLCDLLKVSQSTVYRYMRGGKLPQPVDGFGPHINRWRTTDVEAWYRNVPPRSTPDATPQPSQRQRFPSTQLTRRAIARFLE
jgi:excisionase family DNA binding protein